jgi:hypothetical protein
VVWGANLKKGKRKRGEEKRRKEEKKGKKREGKEKKVKLIIYCYIATAAATLANGIRKLGRRKMLLLTCLVSTIHISE